MQRVHRLGQKRRNHAQTLQGLRHTRKETTFLLTKGISKTSKADSTARLCLWGSHTSKVQTTLCGTSSVVKYPLLNWKVGWSIHGHWVNCRSTSCARVFTQNRLCRGQISGSGLPLTAVTKNNKKKHTEVRAKILFWYIYHLLHPKKYSATKFAEKILDSVNSEIKHSMQATTSAWTTNCRKQNAYVCVIFYML